MMYGLRHDLSGMTEEFKGLCAFVEGQLRSLRAARAAHQAQRELVTALNDQQAEMVCLDVGGSPFHTGLKSLRKDKGCMLEVLADGVFGSELMADGSVFIDRDPTHFPAILNFLRSPPDTLALPTQRVQRRAVLREAVFYGMGNLAQAVRSYLPAPTPGTMQFQKYDQSRYNVLNEGRTLMKASHTGPRMAVCSPRMAAGRHVWRLSFTTPLVALGIVRTKAHENIQPGSDDLSYVLYGKPHEVWHRNQSSVYGQLLSPEDVVEAELNFCVDGGCLSFKVNDRPLGVAFRDIGGQGPFYAAVYVYSKLGHSCSILSYHHSLPDPY